MIGLVAAVILTTTSVLLFGFGVNLLYLTWRATRQTARPRIPLVQGGEPKVCIQLPIYNERYVAERVLDATCAIDWPPARLEVQVLDDSDDETTAILATRIAHWRRNGVDAIHIRRGSRTGFKAGALAHGLELTRAPLIAIFDADFVPPPDFLRRTVGAFADPCVAFAQARWGHIDEDYSLFTRLQAMAIDFHFLIEQSARSAMGYFTNFTGTAGVWRRDAIEDAGGWSARTLTEDLDLSYRAQLRGWKAAYVEDLVVPEELPVAIDAYRRQQSRWATGSFQSAFRLLGPVMRSRNRVAVKVQAAAHLLAYGVGPVMLVQLATYPILLLAFGRVGLRLPWYIVDSSAVAILIGIAPWVGFVAAQARRGERWWTGLPSMICQVVGVGMSLNSLIALFRASRPGGVFIRTPKHHITRAGQEWRHQAYVHVGDTRALFEGVTAIAALSIVMVALAIHQWLIAIYAAIFALGFLVVSMMSIADFLEVAALPWSRWRRGPTIAAVALFAGVGALLAFATQIPEPFEDGYGHWLIAANVAATGQLHDPLFGMEDTWLPGYHLLAAAVLHLLGLWQLGALKALSAVLALVTAACVYMLAPNIRQARLAVALLVLNPVFLFTSGSAVVEPLLTTLLTGAGLAAVRGRMKVAALLAALACVTSTKAWVWVVAAAAFVVVEALRSRQAVRSRIAWAAPAVALLVFLQLGFAPASHSVARGTVEVMSATGRGSIPNGALARISELALTYGLAALPLVPFAAIGAVLTLRRQATELWRFVYAPAAVYLAVVFALVASGSYTGSHRYLYPALPAMALLAAAALDRYSKAIRFLAVAASGLLTVGFLPLFIGFAADNNGLVAAGKAAAGRPGTLLTDSPVVAFYSGKTPARITGSQSLPPDRSRAIDWMGTHGVDTLVLEDISYYRATAVFPELARGQAISPFVPLGEQALYQTRRGKPVHAYRMLAVLSLGDVAEGKTASLAKGMTMGQTATGEGMGFGVPIVSYPDGWVYSSTSSTVEISSGVWKRTFQLDTIGGDAPRHYQFVRIASRGAIEVTYALDANGVLIQVRTLWLAPGCTQIGVLNEQSALFNDFAAQDQPTLVGTDFGNWVPVTGSWSRLRSPTLGIEWSVPSVPGAELHAGRESSSPDFNWAGLDYLFPSSFAGATYHINLKEAQ
jgi:cellulose synthase/poly-beta-1,6-N-acetylglucosamine synthase-like glycosyltransferase